MGAPERHPPPDAQRPGFRVRVDDRARIPRPAAQDERAGREGLGGSRPGEFEGEVRPVEMEESHRGWSVRRSRGLDRGLRRGGGRRGGGRHLARHPPRRGSGGSPAAPAGRIDCARPAPPSAGRRRRVRAGSTTAWRVRGGDWSPRRRRSSGHRRHRAVRARRRASPSAGRAPPAGRAGRRCGPGLIRGRQPATGQVEDEQVDRAPGQQRATDGEALVERLRGDDHQPFEPDTAGDRLDRVEAARQVEPGHDRAGVLCLGGEPVDERRPAARAVAADRDARVSRQAARPQDGVERREPGVDDPVVGGRDRLGAMGRDSGLGRGGAGRGPSAGARAEGPVRDRGGPRRPSETAAPQRA